MDSSNFSSVKISCRTVEFMDKAWQFCANLVCSMYHCDMSKRDGTLYRIFSRDSTVMMYCMTQYDIIFHRVQNILELCCTVFKSAKLLYLSLWLYIHCTDC